MREGRKGKWKSNQEEHRGNTRGRERQWKEIDCREKIVGREDRLGVEKKILLQKRKDYIKEEEES